MKRLRIIGYGARFRRDDGAGLAAGRLLLESPPQGAEVLLAEGDGLDLLEKLKGAQKAVVIDAMRSGAAPGSVRLFRPLSRGLPKKGFALSTHAVGLREAIELGRGLGALPPSLSVYGIEGEDFSLGEGLTPKVEAAVRKLARRLSGGGRA